MKTLVARLFVSAIALGTTVGIAQTHGQHGGSYADLMTRPVKALSETQIEDMRAGRGMGLALPAELNGYPGPSHTLELADRLGLDDTQKARLRDLFATMKKEAITVGEQVIALETDLDRQFTAGTITLPSLASATAAIGERQAALRAAHLKYHLLTKDLLNPEQIKRYSDLRGYTAPAPHHGSHTAPTKP